MQYEDTVVAGVDGSALDRPVLEWAAREAAARGVRLWVAHCWEWSDDDRTLLPIYVEPKAQSPAERLVGAAVATVASEFPELEVSGALGYGRVAPSLLEVSHQAALVVVGARGAGGFPGLLVGSISAQLAAHGGCPVAVVRPPINGTDVVVGIDGSVQSIRALEVGLAEARRLGGKVVAVHSYRLPPRPAAYGPNPGVDEKSHRAAAEKTLHRILGPVEQDATDVKIERLVQAGPPARVLCEAAADAAALVVGVRGLGGFAGMVLGSVSQQVLRHAPGTVVVAR